MAGEIKTKLNELFDNLSKVGHLLSLDKKKDRLANLEIQLQNEEIWSENKKMQKLLKEKSDLEFSVFEFEKIYAKVK